MATTPAVYRGNVRVIDRFYRVSEGGRVLEDVSAYIDKSGATITAEPGSGNGITLAASSTPEGFGQFEPFRDRIRVERTIEYNDPETGAITTRTASQGVFIYTPPPSRIYASEYGIEQIDGRGPLWRMRSRKIGKPYSLASGTNVVEAMISQCAAVSVLRSIPGSSDTLPKKRTWPSNATREDIFNDLARSIGYVPAFEDRFGRICSHIFKRLGDQDPSHYFDNDSANVVSSSPPRRETDLSKLFNEVTVIGNDPKKTDTPIISYRLNNDPGSETSTVRLGTEADPLYLTHDTVEDPNLTSQAACDKMADSIMDAAAGALVTMTVTTLPILDWSLDETVKCDLATSSGQEVAKGIWRVQRVSIALGKPGLVTWELSKVLRWGQAE